MTTDRTALPEQTLTFTVDQLITLRAALMAQIATIHRKYPEDAPEKQVLLGQARELWQIVYDAIEGTK